MSDSEPVEKRFIFHANAVAFAAHIRRPVDYQIPAVAASCLPVTGGVSSASAGEQSYQDIIRFASASTSASGDFADTRRAVDFTHGNFAENELSTQTFVDSKLSGLKIAITQDHPPAAAGRVRSIAIGELHARLESFSDRKNPVAFRGLEAQIQGVVVDDKHELLVAVAPEICTQYETYDKLLKAYDEDGGFRKKYGPLFYPTGHEKTGVGALLSKRSLANASGLVLATVVTSLRWAGSAPDGAEIRGNRLKIEGIGTIYFGELLIDRKTRRLTLLRFQLGSPHGGEGAGCDVQSNGDSWPPGL